MTRRCRFITLPVRGLQAKVFGPVDGEYIVRMYAHVWPTGWALIPSADYFTTDQDDACASAVAMLNPPVR